MIKTTVYLDPEIAAALRHIARMQERSQAALIREALRQYTRQVQRPSIAGIGEFRSSRNDLASRTEEILEEAARSGGWR